MKRVAIAALRRPRGIRGELVATSLSDFPERFSQLDRVWIGDRELEVANTWWHGDDLVFKFAGIDSIDAASELAGFDVEIPEDKRVALPPGACYPDMLVGFEVFAEGRSLGRVSGWQELPGQTLLEVGEVEIPYGLVSRVDMTERRLEVALPEGLLDLNR